MGKEIQNMNNVKRVALSGLFLAIAAMLSWLQIPVFFLSSFLTIELSLIALLIARRYIGIKYTLAIAIISPWTAMATFWAQADPLAISILIFMNITVITTEWALTRDKTSIKNMYLMSVLIMVLVTFIMVTFNLLLFTPAYYGFDWDILLSDGLWEYIVSWSLIYIPFNVIKLSAILFTYPPILLKMKKIIK